jgi:alpha-D-xyloside xylohydrolase
MLKSSWAVLVLAVLFCAVLPIPATAAGFEKQEHGIVFQVGGGSLNLQVMDENIIRVALAKDPSFFTRKTIDVIAAPKIVPWTVTETAQSITIATANVKAVIDRTTGQVSFLDAAGRPILAEVANGRVIEPAEVQGEKTFHVRQQWQANGDESLYGLGQQQLGMLDIKGYDLELWQHNTNIVVPFLVSSRGYGIYWQNISITRFGDLRPFVAVPAENLFDGDGKQGGLTATRIDGAGPPATTAKLDIDVKPVPSTDALHMKRLPDMCWEGAILAPQSGDYQFRTYSNGGIKVWLDGKLLISHWRENWLTDNEQVKVRLEANRKYPIKIEWNTEQGSTMQLTWKTPSPDVDKISLWSEVGDGIDYYFVYGPMLDTVIAGMRTLTGRAAMMPNWAFGLWQSRQRYETEQQSLDVVKNFRARQIPFDNLVQDWQYWRVNQWGSHQFDPDRFPNPDAWIKAIHELHAHLMISVWGKFYPGTDNFEAMQQAGYLYQPTLQEQMKDWMGYVYTDYDAFNPGARKLFWEQVNERLFKRGIDAWWMDATEPDITPSPPTIEGQKTHFPQTAMGTASRVFNGYALLNSEGVYLGQRSVAPNQRVFILTRSGYAGEQRYATASWSGDITSTWTAMAKQIPAGLGFSIAGVPYWTQDVGGYTMQEKFSAKQTKPADDEEWYELNTRWFEFGTFTPLLRVHGELRVREMWTMGGDHHPAYQAHLKFTRLRYRMFPYIYSLAGAVTQNAGTFMRPLVMDFPLDTAAREINDEYMFGPAFLVAPVTRYQARHRSLYLPSGAKIWYNFWTGATVPTGPYEAPAPLDAMPVFVRAGSIIPFGPELQYIAEKPSDPTTLYVYAGANGRFTFYEDEGVNYAYEQGAFSLIPMEWNDKARTLDIGKRQGSFAGMLHSRTFQVVIVSPQRPIGFSFDPKPIKSVQYQGEAVRLKLQ